MLENIYFHDISRYPQLSPQEELILAHRVRQGDTEARNQLIEANLLLVVNIARQYLRPGVEGLDLIQEGNIGLIKAVDIFDPTHGNRLSTLAFYWINKQIQRFLEKEQDDTLSLDMELADTNEYLQLSDTIEDKSTILGDQTIKHIDAVMEHNELQQLVSRMLDTFSHNEKQVLQLLYGLNRNPQMSRKEIAKVLGVSPQYISRIRIDALKRLRKMARTLLPR